jgi:hypothetical protein
MKVIEITLLMLKLAKGSTLGQLSNLKTLQLMLRIKLKKQSVLMTLLNIFQFELALVFSKGRKCKIFRKRFSAYHFYRH